MALPSWIVLTACKKWLHSGYYCPRGLVRPAKRQRNVWTSRLMSNPGGGRGSPFKFLESVCLWFDEKDWIWGQRVRVAPRVPCLLLLGGLKNNDEAESRRQVGSSWLQLIENKPFVLLNANVLRALHSWGCGVGQGGRSVYVCTCLWDQAFFLRL